MRWATIRNCRTPQTASATQAWQVRSRCRVVPSAAADGRGLWKVPCIMIASASQQPSTPAHPLRPHAHTWNMRAHTRQQLCNNAV